MCKGTACAVFNSVVIIKGAVVGIITFVEKIVVVNDGAAVGKSSLVEYGTGAGQLRAALDADSTTCQVVERDIVLPGTGNGQRAAVVDDTVVGNGAVGGKGSSHPGDVQRSAEIIGKAAAGVDSQRLGGQCGIIVKGAFRLECALCGVDGTVIGKTAPVGKKGV